MTLLSAGIINEEAGPSGPTVIDDFESGSLDAAWQGDTGTAVVTTVAAHDGTYGCSLEDRFDAIYRVDFDILPPTTFEVWVWIHGRSKFRFGLSDGNNYYEVQLRNNRNIISKEVAGSGTTLAEANTNYPANTWSHLVVDWGSDGSITSTVYDETGVSRGGQISTLDTDHSSGGVGLACRDSGEYFDTIVYG